MSAPPVLEPRERFLRDIADRIPAERIAEIHLFPPLRSGGLESGVAVIAAIADPGYAQGELPPPIGEGGVVGANELGLEAEGVMETGPPPDIEDTVASADEADRSHAGAIETSPDDSGGPPPDFQSTPSSDDPSHRSSAEDIDRPRPHRLVVYRAVYRWTRKGPDRGRWEVDITAEADAPLPAVSDVVRGVQRRAGEDGEPELITPDALRVVLSDRPWAAAM